MTRHTHRGKPTPAFYPSSNVRLLAETMQSTAQDSLRSLPAEAVAGVSGKGGASIPGGQSETRMVFVGNKDIYRVPSNAMIPEMSCPAYMEYDAAGNPILIPVKPEDLEKAKAAAGGMQMQPEITGTTDVGAEEDGNVEDFAAAERKGSHPTGTQQSESVPAAEESLEEAEVDLAPRVLEEREQVLDEHIVSFYSMPSHSTIAISLSEDASYPQPLASFLPASPFITSDGKVAVDVYAVKADMTEPKELESLPKYTSMQQGLERRNTLLRSLHEPTAIELF